MRRADRRTPNDDNTQKYSISQREEPTSPSKLKKLLMTARSQRDEFQSKLQEVNTQLVHVQHNFQTSQSEISQWKESAIGNYQLYLEEHQKLQEAST